MTDREVTLIAECVTFGNRRDRCLEMISPMPDTVISRPHDGCPRATFSISLE